MLIVLLVISILVSIIGIIKLSKYGEDGLGIAFTSFGVLFSLTLLIIMPIALTNTLKMSQMDNRIAVYEEENTRIEEQIKTAIQVYQDYEKEIYENINLNEISSEKLLLIASVYPELKSDTMVQELIHIYVNNTNEIKQLKVNKLDYELWCWWLCFG